MAELKKCPFCGSVADLHQNQAGMFVVRCVKFGCWVSTMPCDFEETAIIKWNTRPTTTEAEIRAKAIDEFAEKLSLEISESIIWGMVVTAHRDGNCSETSDEIVEYVLDTVREIAEQLKEE